jgi:hypothetical protein
MHIASIGIDLGKTTFHLVAARADHHRGPESDSPSRGRIHLRRLVASFNFKPLAVRRRTIHYRQPSCMEA